MKAFLIELLHVASLDHLLVLLFVVVVIQLVWILALTSLFLRTIGVQRVMRKQLLDCRELYVLLARCSGEIHGKISEIKQLIRHKR